MTLRVACNQRSQFRAVFPRSLIDEQRLSTPNANPSPILTLFSATVVCLGPSTEPVILLSGIHLHPHGQSNLGYPAAVMTRVFQGSVVFYRCVCSALPFRSRINDSYHFQ